MQPRRSGEEACDVGGRRGSRRQDESVHANNKVGLAASTHQVAGQRSANVDLADELPDLRAEGLEALQEQWRRASAEGNERESQRKSRGPSAPSQLQEDRQE